MQIKKRWVVVGSGVHWQISVFIFYYCYHHHHHHHHHQRKALALVDVAPTYTKGASHSQWLKVT